MSKAILDPARAYAAVHELELDAAGLLARTAVVFLTNRQCPFTCVMCDLWINTLDDPLPAGVIPQQIRAALATLPAARQIKLYNAGSFFDPRAVPESDYDAVANALAGIPRVIVESHPALIGHRVDRFIAALDSGVALEVAMGLETAHPDALERLNKRITVASFADAAAALRVRDVALRVFLLISPPFVPQAEQDEWLERSVQAAFECGASVVSLIPTRAGNGTLEALAVEGSFAGPSFEDVERSAALALTAADGRGRVLVDLWDLERFAAGAPGAGERRARLAAMNLAQQVLPPHACPACAGAATT